MTVDLASYLLTPFFVAWLALSQLADLGCFALARLSEWSNRLWYRVSVSIDTLPYSFATKYHLMIAVSWIPTAILTVAAILLTARLSQTYFAPATPVPDTLDTGLAEARIINVDWPDNLRLASTSATLTLREPELFALAQEYAALAPAEIATFGQAEKLNLALIYYYFGNDDHYLNYWHQARLMDPNDPVFR